LTHFRKILKYKIGWVVPHFCKFLLPAKTESCCRERPICKLRPVCKRGWTSMRRFSPIDALLQELAMKFHRAALKLILQPAIESECLLIFCSNSVISAAIIAVPNLFGVS